MSTTTVNIFQRPNGVYWVNKVINGRRLRLSLGTKKHEVAAVRAEKQIEAFKIKSK